MDHIGSKQGGTFLVGVMAASCWCVVHASMQVEDGSYVPWEGAAKHRQWARLSTASLVMPWGMGSSALAGIPRSSSAGGWLPTASTDVVWLVHRVSWVSERLCCPHCLGMSSRKLLSTNRLLALGMKGDCWATSMLWRVKISVKCYPAKWLPDAHVWKLFGPHFIMAYKTFSCPYWELTTACLAQHGKLSDLLSWWKPVLTLTHTYVCALGCTSCSRAFCCHHSDFYPGHYKRKYCGCCHSFPGEKKLYNIPKIASQVSVPGLRKMPVSHPFGKYNSWWWHSCPSEINEVLQAYWRECFLD